MDSRDVPGHDFQSLIQIVVDRLPRLVAPVVGLGPGVHVGPADLELYEASGVPTVVAPAKLSRVDPMLLRASLHALVNHATLLARGAVVVGHALLDALVRSGADRAGLEPALVGELLDVRQDQLDPDLPRDRSTALGLTTLVELVVAQPEHLNGLLDQRGDALVELVQTLVRAVVADLLLTQVDGGLGQVLRHRIGRLDTPPGIELIKRVLLDRLHGLWCDRLGGDHDDGRGTADRGQDAGYFRRDLHR